MHSIYPIFEGLQHGFYASSAKKAENSAKAQKNPFLVVLFQTTEGWQTIAIINRALKATGSSSLSWKTRAVIYVAPSILALTKGSGLLPEQLGTLYYLSGVVSAAVLLYFGHTFFAVPALLTLAIGYADRQGLLPALLKRTLDQSLEPLIMVLGLFVGGLYDRCFSAFYLAHLGANTYLSSQGIGKPKQLILQERRLTPQIVQDFLERKIDLKINRHHIHCKPSSLTTSAEDSPLKDKVLHCLQKERNAWMRSFYNEQKETFDPETKKMLDSNDETFYGMFINSVRDQFHVGQVDCENNNTSTSDPLIAYLMEEYVVGSPFWRRHQLGDCTETLKAACGASETLKADFYQFWNEWIDRQEIGETEKGLLREELASKRLYSMPLEEDGMPESGFLQLMLFDMGIAEKASLRANDLHPTRMEIVIPANNSELTLLN